MANRDDCFAYGVDECLALYNLECEDCKFYKSKQQKRDDDFKTIDRLKALGWAEAALKRKPGYKAYIKQVL